MVLFAVPLLIHVSRLPRGQSSKDKIEGVVLLVCSLINQGGPGGPQRVASRGRAEARRQRLSLSLSAPSVASPPAARELDGGSTVGSAGQERASGGSTQAPGMGHPARHRPGRAEQTGTGAASARRSVTVRGSWRPRRRTAPRRAGRRQTGWRCWGGVSGAVRLRPCSTTRSRTNR